jgi:hypothetical protein
LISVHDTGTAGALGDLSRFRQEFYQCLTARADTLFELADAVLCAPGPVTSLVELSLAAEHRRGHGALYDSLNQGRIDIGRVPQCYYPPTDTAWQGRSHRAGHRCQQLVAAGCEHQPGAVVLPHTYGRGKGQAQMIAGWPYSFVAALEPGRTSWTAILDAQRLEPADEDTAVAAEQLRAVVERLIAAGHWQAGDPEIWIVGVRVRSDRVMVFPAPPCTPGQRGRCDRHGAEFAFKDPEAGANPPTPRPPRPAATAPRWPAAGIGRTRG